MIMKKLSKKSFYYFKVKGYLFILFFSFDMYIKCPLCVSGTDGIVET